MQKLLHGRFDQLRADEQDQRRHDQPADVFHAVMPVGMLTVGGLGRHLKADERHDRACRVREVVNGVGGDGDAAAERADGELCRAEQNVADDPDPAGQPPAGGAHGKIAGLSALLNIFFEKTRHKNTTFASSAA